MSETSPYRARQLAIEELKIRYDADFPIEADMPVVMQEKILTQIAQWVQSNEVQVSARRLVFRRSSDAGLTDKRGRP